MGHHERLWELDCIRGVAICLVVVYHLLFDIAFFGIYDLDFSSFPTKLLAYGIASTFLLLVGISLTLRRSQLRSIATEKEIRLSLILRGLKIIVIALGITLATWLYLGEGFVIFGILHCIGLSMILAVPLLSSHVVPLVGGLIFIVLGIILYTITIDSPYLLWLGFKPTVFYTVDYYPLLPWFGVVLLGVFLGNRFYSNGKRTYISPEWSSTQSVRIMSFLGRHTLIIYLIHQPIIVGLLYLLFPQVFIG